MSTETMLSQIDNAIGAHGMWKMKLRASIRSGKCEVSPVVAASDCNCAFGKWLNSNAIDAATKAGVPYGVIKRVHADFHRAAGAVLRGVEAGHIAMAEAEMAGDFNAQSEKLVRALMKWKGEVKQRELA